MILYGTKVVKINKKKINDFFQGFCDACGLVVLTFAVASSYTVFGLLFYAFILFKYNFLKLLILGQIFCSIFMVLLYAKYIIKVINID